VRVATLADTSAIGQLMRVSARGLCEPFYDARQTASVERFVAVLDDQLVVDGTYYVVDGGPDGELAGCGGWSRRDKLFTGTDTSGTSRLVDPAHEPARVRAMFVHPTCARRGLGRAILARSEAAAIAAGFSRAELFATLPGEPLYLACGYTVIERAELVLPDGVAVGGARMGKSLART
jgi:GNAT superfamily N-acetyltransferase